jgi:hypothetical protein
MVKEIEAFVNVESVKTGSSYPPYSNDSSIPVITGMLADAGKSMTLDVNRIMKSGYIRFAHLWYAVVDNANNVIDFIFLESKSVLTELAGLPASTVVTSFDATSYVFDVSKVAVMPKTYRELSPAKEVVIDLFTYEANITDCTGEAIYGKKHLVVPYNAEVSPNLTFKTSTDGWYPFGVVDYQYRDVTKTYADSVEAGDIVFWYTGNDTPATDITLGELRSGKLFIANEKTTQSPEAVGVWSEVKESDILRYISIPFPPTKTKSATIFGTDLIVTHHIKYNSILDVLKRASFKKDHKSLDTLMYMMALREKAVDFMSNGEQVRSTQLLDEIEAEYNAYYAEESEAIVTKITAKYVV